VAQALLQTKRMRIGPGGFLLPFHHRPSWWPAGWRCSTT
jgi:hypothetical protein